MSRKIKARQLQQQGFNCAQRTLAVFCGECGLDEKTALKIAGGFGGGMQQGEVCGMVTGAVMALGLKYGHSEAGDEAAKQKISELVRLFHEKFKERNRSIICKQMLGCDPSTAEGKAFVKEHGLSEKICAKAGDDAIDILEEIFAAN